MHRWLRIGLTVALLASIGIWAGGSHIVSAQGAVYTDTMDASSTELLPTVSPDASKYLYAYQNDQYIMQTLQTGFSGALWVSASVPAMTDSSVAVDAAISGDLTGKYVIAGCRADGNQGVGYIVEVHPDTGTVYLTRWDPDSATGLGTTTSPAVQTGNANSRIEIQCVGNTITGLINGQQVLTAQDTTYTSGTGFIGVGTTDATTDQLLGGFDNLTITDLSTGTVAQPTQAPVQPTQAATPPTPQTGVPAAPTAATGSDQTGLTPITEPSVDPAGTFRDAQRASVGAPPVFSQQDDVPFEVPSGQVETLNTGVQVTDFYAELHYQVQSDVTGSGVLFGYQFWADGNGNGYQLTVATNGATSNWDVTYVGPNGQVDIDSGTLPAGSVDLTAGAYNVIVLTVYHGFAIISTNGSTPDAVVTLTQPAAGSQVLALATFLNPNTTGPMTMNAAITLMGVWDLSSGGYVDIFGLGATDPTAAPTLQAGPTQAAAQPTQAESQPTQVPAQPTAAIQPTTAGGLEGGSGTAPITDPRVDPARTLAEASVVSLMNAPAAGPFQASADLAASDSGFSHLPSGVNLTDFYATQSYITPPTTPSGSWGFGFAFWDDGQGNSYDVFVQGTNGAALWVLGQQTPTGYTILQSGDLAPGAVDFTPGAQNQLSLVVYQGLALLSGNDGTLDATIDLGGATGSGDVLAEVGFLADDTTSGQSLPISMSGFSVWDLSSGMYPSTSADMTPTAGTQPMQPTAMPTQAALPTQAVPAPTEALMPTAALPPAVSPTVTPSTDMRGNVDSNGQLTQLFNNEKAAAMAGAPIFSGAPGALTQTNTGIALMSAGVAVADFYATATFVNPTDMSTPSDISIGFRDMNDNQEYRFLVRSDGAWGLAIGTAVPVVQGAVTNFDASPGASNTLEIVANGSTGLLAINGQVVQQVDLSANLNAGDVYVATGMFDSTTVEGRQVPYSNFAVYQLTAG